MTLTAGTHRRTESTVRGAPTSPLRVFAADHQPIRLLAELEAITPAELVHRALSSYLAGRGRDIAGIAARAQEMAEAGNLEGLADLLKDVATRRRAAHAERLAALGQPEE
jgi:hypothetical protein